jgi:hypothetical protein
MPLRGRGKTRERSGCIDGAPRCLRGGVACGRLFFCPVLAVLSSSIGDLDRLRVGDACAGLPAASKAFPQIFPELCGHLREHAPVAPVSEVVINRIPRRKIMRKHSLGTATPQHVKDRVDDGA